MEVKRSNDMLDVAQFQTRSNSKAFPSCVPVPECSCVLEARGQESSPPFYCVCVCPCLATAYMQRSETTLWGQLSSSSFTWAPGIELSSVGLLSKHLYLLSHLTNPLPFLRLFLYLGWSGWPASDAPAVQPTTSRWCCGSPSPRACTALCPLSHLPNPKAYLLSRDVKYWLHCSSTPTTAPPTTGPLFYSQLNT